jgi:HemY protein
MRSDEAATTVKTLPQERSASGRGDSAVFVTPRAPDDPGTEPLEPELEQPVARRTFRSVN